MKDRIERFVLLPFTAGCISESSIPVAVQHTRRSKLDTTTPTRTREAEDRKDEEEGCLDDDGSFSFQKLLKNIKNLPQLFVYKDELEAERMMEIGLPTDVKHVTHIGMDGFATSMFSGPELINIHSLDPLAQRQLPIKSQVQTTTTSLQPKCCNNAIAQS